MPIICIMYSLLFRRMYMLDFIKRNTPRICDSFILKTIEPDGEFDCYEVYAEDGKIVLAGNSNLSLAMAYYRYLSEFCGIIITSGDYDISTLGTAPLPDRKITCTVKQKIRARTSYEFFALEGNYWGFDRWEKEIDFMAMHGINTPLQPVGFDGVLYKTLVDFGLDDKLCLEFSSGPAYIMRQLTGNVAGFNAVNSRDYLERKIYIGRMITEREKELGMSPVLPASLPSVPFSLRKKYIKMDIFKAPLWYNLPPIFYIKPENAFYQLFCGGFIRKQRELLGDTKTFFFEPLYEVNHKGYNSFLSEFAYSLSKMLNDFDPEAVCYTHLSAINSEFFKDVEGTKFIFINDNNNTELIKGKRYINAIKGNYYGRTTIYGDIEKVCKYLMSDENSLGTALELDTFRENPLYCAAALKALTANEPFDSDSLAADFARKRYKTDEFCDDIVKLKNLCYNSDTVTGSILCARPTTKTEHCAPFDTFEKSYDYRELFSLAKNILDNPARKNDALRADIQSIIRQSLSDFAYPVYLKSTQFFRDKNVRNFEQASNLFLEICEDVDRLLKTREETNLSTKYEEAHSLGETKDEREQIDINFLMLHTIWGPFDHTILYDIAWAEWGGLVKDYYAARWHMYFRSLAVYFDKPKKLKDVSRKQPLDRNEYKGSYQLKRLALHDNNFLQDYVPRRDGIGEEDTIEVAKEIIEKYSEVINQF